MYCKKCGKKLNEGDMFCSGCGTKVEPEEKSPFRMDTINWDLDGYPQDTPRVSRDTMFDWSSVSEKTEAPEPDRNVTEEDLFGSATKVDVSSDDEWKDGATVRVDPRRPNLRNTLASDDPAFKVGSSIFSSSRGFDEEEEVQVNSQDFVPPLNRGGNIFYTGSNLKKSDIEERAVMPSRPESIIPDDDTSAFLADSVDISDAIQPLNPEPEYEDSEIGDFEQEYLSPRSYDDDYEMPRETKHRAYDDDDDDEKESSFTKKLFAGVSNVFSKLDILSEDDEEIEDVEDIVDDYDEGEEYVAEPVAVNFEEPLPEREEPRSSRIKSPIRFKSPKSTAPDRKTAVEDFERDIREASEAGNAIAVEKHRNPSDKFYTFNQKSDEFRALLDEEYERLRQRIQEESGGTENSALERAYKKGEEARAKRAAEEEARLKAEEEARIKAEEEARLKAEEEAKIKAEEEARIKAEEEARLKAEEEAKIKAEEEARLKAEEEAKIKAEEEARLKAEEEARIKAEEEARLKAEEEAKAKAEEEASVEAAAETEVIAEAEDIPESEDIAEIETMAEAEAAKAEAPEIEIEDVVEIPEDDDATSDFERRLAELTSQMESLPSYSGTVAAAAGASSSAVSQPVAADEVEIKTIDVDAEDELPITNRNTVVIDRNEAKEALKEEERRLRYGDIFNNDEEEEEEEEERGGRAKLIILDILIAILLVCVILTAIMVFGENTAIGQKLHSLIGLSTQSQEAEEPAEGEAAEASEAAGETATETDVSATAAAIVQQATRNQNIGEIAEDTALLFDGEKTYSLEGVQYASLFTDSAWYTDGDGNNVTYMSELVGSIIEYHSKLVDRYNSGSEDVLALVDSESKLYTELSEIAPEEGVTHDITKLQIGEVRQDGTNFYMLIRLAESVSNQEAPIVTTKLVHMDVATNQVVIKDIVPVE